MKSIGNSVDFKTCAAVGVSFQERNPWADTRSPPHTHTRARKPNDRLAKHIIARRQNPLWLWQGGRGGDGREYVLFYDDRNTNIILYRTQRRSRRFCVQHCIIIIIVNAPRPGFSLCARISPSDKNTKIDAYVIKIITPFGFQ